MRAFRKFSALLVLLLSCCLSPADEVQIPDDPHRFHLFILAGQSNMAGRGKVDRQDPPPTPAILSLNRQGQWVIATDPLHFDKPAIAGVGLGRTFADDYHRHAPDVVVGLIPCAVGGSAISTWEPGGFHEQTMSHPWDDMVPRVRKAMQQGVLKGVLWHQGESDSGKGRAAVYEQKLHTLVQRFRTTFGAAELPFVVGQLGQFKDRPWDEGRRTVDRAHRLLPEKVPHTAFVPSDGLQHKGDRTHFNAASYRAFGHRYFTAYQKLVTGHAE